MILILADEFASKPIHFYFKCKCNGFEIKYGYLGVLKNLIG